MYDLVIKGGTLALEKGTLFADLAISEGRIAAIGKELEGKRVISAEGMLVLPGGIDMHTHMALPVGGTRSSDDFYSGTVAAAFGGITTIADFTVGSPHTSLKELRGLRMPSQASWIMYFTPKLWDGRDLELKS